MKVYFQGEAKDCRLKVQELNALKSTEQEKLDMLRLSNFYNNQNRSRNQYDDDDQNFEQDHQKPIVNKWAKFLTKEDMYEQDDEENDEN